MESYKLNKNIKNVEGIYKNGKKQFGEMEIEKQEFHQYERPISIKKYRY